MAKRGSWSVAPSLFADVVEEDLTKRMRSISLAMLQEIVLRSPVDTGLFRNNHVVTILSPTYTPTLETDVSGAGAITRGLTAMTGLEPYTVVYIQNNLAYAQKLEDGHSKQAPPGGIYAASFHGVSQAFK